MIEVTRPSVLHSPANPNAEPADVIASRAIQQMGAGSMAAAGATLDKGVADHPDNQDLARLQAELAHGVVVLFQYQTPEETSPA